MGRCGFSGHLVGSHEMLADGMLAWSKWNLRIDARWCACVSCQNSCRGMRCRIEQTFRGASVTWRHPGIKVKRACFLEFTLRCIGGPKVPVPAPFWHGKMRNGEYFRLRRPLHVPRRSWPIKPKILPCCLAAGRSFLNLHFKLLGMQHPPGHSHPLDQSQRQFIVAVDHRRGADWHTKYVVLSKGPSLGE